ncbi:MAG: TolC family outer membrane protein, partial [Hyphomonadaceae bacterium]
MKRARGRVHLALAGLSLLLGARASAQTLDEAVAAAYRNNPTLQDARLGVRASREDTWQARAGYLPSISLQGAAGRRELDIESTNIFGPTHQNVDQGVSSSAAVVTQQLYTGGRRGAQMRLADAGVEGARQSLRGAEQQILLSAIQAYLNLVRDEGIVRIREAYLADLLAQLAATRRRLDVGEVTRTDLSQSQARVAGARAQLAQAQANAEASRAAYAQVIGQAPDALQPPGPPPTDTPASLDEALAQADASNPQILVAQQNERAADARTDIERAASRPQLSVVGRADSQKNTDQLEQQRDSTSLTAQLTVPLFTGGYDWARVRQGRINEARARAQTEARRRQIAAGVVAAWTEVTAARAVIAAAAEQVSASLDAVAGAERELGIGTRSNIDVLNAREDLQN